SARRAGVEEPLELLGGNPFRPPVAPDGQRKAGLPVDAESLARAFSQGGVQDSAIFEEFADIPDFLNHGRPPPGFAPTESTPLFLVGPQSIEARCLNYRACSTSSQEACRVRRSSGGQCDIGV